MCISLKNEDDGNQSHWPRYGSHLFQDVAQGTQCCLSDLGLIGFHEQGTLPKQEEQSPQYGNSLQPVYLCKWKYEQAGPKGKGTVGQSSHHLSQHFSKNSVQNQSKSHGITRECRQQR